MELVEELLELEVGSTVTPTEKTFRLIIFTESTFTNIALNKHLFDRDNLA